MSSVAKKMLERHGWKEGMGLGKNAQGVKTYVKVVRRDPHTATGLGHAADSTHAPQASTLALELDAVYSDLTMGKMQQQNSEKKKNKRMTSSAVESDSNAEDDTSRHAAGVGDKKGGVETRKRLHSPCRSRESTTDGSDSDSDSDSSSNENITRMTDDELLKRCGGVRLGRAGRHRFFEGKLRRIEEAHQGR